MNRIRLTLTAAGLAFASLAVALPSAAQSPVKAPTKALRTTATAAASRAADKVGARVATAEAAGTGQATPKPKPAASTTPATTPAAPAAKPGTAAAKPAATTAAAATAAAAGKAPAVDSTRGARGTSVSKRGAASEMVFHREIYTYPGAGRRDPFASLLKSGDLRPLISDLRLVTVIYDATGRNSVAILRDLTTKDQYRVKTGQTLGRMRVAQIQPKHVVFTIDEFGYNRQETLSLSDITTARNQ